MKQTKEQLKFNRRTNLAYIGFVFQTFFKRPFGYIIAGLYVLYLSIILLIVPAAIHFEPLFIWSNAAFNMPIFNLFFIAAAAGALAVSVFRTGRDDGTELTLSAKPITKGARVFGKTFVYLVVMLGFSAISLIILALIYPVFGEYNIYTNITGITHEKYTALLLSVFIGNMVNMLLFGGFSVLISMVGGQVITIIASVGVAFLMCLLNVIFPIAISSPREVLANKYSTSINSMAANTLSQFNKNEESNVKQFASIQCVADKDGTEISHFDTAEYWAKANRESGLKGTNYVDFGKQLSYLYSAFGLDQSKLEAATKLMIGANNSHNYVIDTKTHITNDEVQQSKDYPIAIYALKSKQGVSYPVVHMLSGNMGLDTNNWYAETVLFQADYNACIVASRDNTRITSSLELRNKLKEGKTWFKMSELVLSSQQLDRARSMFNTIIEVGSLASGTAYKYYQYNNEGTASPATLYSALAIIKAQNNELFWQGEWNNLSVAKKFFVTSQIQVAWSVFAQELQKKYIAEYCAEKSIDDHFPFKSTTIKKWYADKVENEQGEKGELYYKQKQIENIFNNGIFTDFINEDQTTVIYPKIPVTTLEYCETYNNIYQYNVKSFYNVNALVVIWTCISVGLFTTSIIVYKKTDFK